MDGEALPEEGALKLRLKYKLKKASGGKGRAELVGGGGQENHHHHSLSCNPRAFRVCRAPWLSAGS